MRIGDVRQINGRYLPDGTVQQVNIGIGQIAGQAQTLVCDDGTTRQGLAMVQFLQGTEFVAPPNLIVDAPPGTKPNPTPPGSRYKIGSKATFGRAYLLDQHYGSPRELSPTGETVAQFGAAIVTGSAIVTFNGVPTDGWKFRQNILAREWWAPK